MNKEQELYNAMVNELTTAFLTANILGHEDDEINYVAKILVERGIGDKKQAVEEALEKLKGKQRVLMGKDGWMTFNVVTISDIDELFTELYGEGL